MTAFPIRLPSTPPLQVSVGLLTFNHLTTGRQQHFWDTYHSLSVAGLHSLTVVTNGSTDGTADVVRGMGGLVDDGDTIIAYGMQRAIEAALDHEPDIVLFSADDITYVRDWLPRLVRFWQAAPDDVKLATLYLEPEWDWNRPLGAADIGGERVLFRASVPGGCWSFRATDWPLIGPIPQKMPGEDLDICQRLRAARYRLAALDLGSHEGRHVSAWGNRSEDYAKPLNARAWGFAEVPHGR